MVNQLLEQNEQLKQENEKYKQFFNIPVKDDGSSMCIMEMLEENEQLKQFKQSVFNLIDKSLEKDKQNYEMTYEDYLNGRIEALEELKKELLE